MATMKRSQSEIEKKLSHSGPSKRQKEHTDDEDEDHEEDITDGTPSKFKRVNKPGRPAEAGIISEVYVENFMCHRKLTVKLCRNVNFISGQNGSGKSAILASIQICLGAGAKRTHRAKNLKELIRKEAGTNCAGAKVRVTLFNQGDDAFMHSQYGDFIIVERSISHRGYNGYKLLDHKGNEVSRSKKDLDAMLDQLNIQVENPVAVLDQEEAKKFLMGKAEDKYNFFTKATDLERLDRSYANIYDNINNLDIKGDSLKDALTPAYNNMQALKKEWEAFQDLDKLQEKISEQRTFYAWSLYNIELNELRNQQSTLNQLEGKQKKKMHDIESYESASDPQEEESILKQKLDTLTEEANEAFKNKQDKEKEIQFAYEPIKQNSRILKSLKRELHAAKRSLDSTKNILKETRDEIIRAAGSAETDEAKRVAKIKATEEELVAGKSSLESMKKKIASLLARYEELEPNVEQAKANSQNTAKQKYVVNQKLKEMQSSSGSSMTVFGQLCVLMSRKVNEARNKFRGPVVGPIGTHIKVSPGKEKFAQVAEFGLGSSFLDRFIVTNDADRRLLMKIRNSIGCSSRDCGIFQISEGPRYKVPPPPCPEVETIASVLSIENDLVFNCLVDNCRIDLKALSTSIEESERALLIEEPGGKESIRGGKIQQVYMLPKGDLWQVRGGSRSMISNDGPALKQTIGVDKRAAIENAKEELEMLNRELNEFRETEAKIVEESKAVKLKWNQENRESRKADNKIRSLQDTLDALQEERQSAENVTIDTTELEEDVKTAELELEKLREKEQESNQKMGELSPHLEKAKRQLEEITTRNNSVLADLERAEKNMDAFLRKQQQKSEVISKKKQKLDQIVQVIENHRLIMSGQAEKVQETIQKARLITHRHKTQCLNKEYAEGTEIDVDNSANEPSIDIESIEPVATEKTPDHYRAKVEQYEKKLNRERERRKIRERDPAVALEKYERAKKDIDAKIKSLNEMKANSGTLKLDLNDRRKRWKVFRKHIATMTNETFDDMLNKKGSSGQIDFDHKGRTLDLIVQKDNANENTQTSDVKALSGGERSFTTLSLLLALGESLETPFRVMDEFDVFLDPQSRKIALDTMVHVAKDMEHRQFIFITPQDLSSLTEDSMLKIMKMKPPVRSNVAGGPSQQTLDFSPRVP